MENAGNCYSSAGERTEKKCKYTKKPKTTDFCCSEEAVKNLAGNQYCRKGDNCIDISASEHYESDSCDAGETCVTSFLTMESVSGVTFGITNIVGNFGTVFVDQSYWQSAVAAKPKSAVFGFLVGGMVWFAVPFCMATTNGLAGRALTTHPSLGSMYLDSAASGQGLTPARVLAAVLGQGGAFILLLQLFMAITSTGSAEIIAVSSILTYDTFYTYIQPELKDQRENRKKLFYKVANNQEMFTLDELQGVLDKLVVAKFFTSTPSDGDVIRLVAAINSATKAYNPTGKAGDSVLSINVKDLYDAVNRSVPGKVSRARSCFA